jgi:CDP-diglyceride synthetase
VSELHTLLTALISGMGLLIATVYFVRRWITRNDSGARAFWAKLEAVEVYDRRRRRRDLGMAIMALISVVFFVGSNYLNPRPHPHMALLFWLVLLALLIWLCALALIDLAEVRRLRNRLMHAARGMFYEEMRQCDTGAQDQHNEEG